MKKALITGVTGQDGSYLSELLLEKGYKVRGLARRTSTRTYDRIEHLLTNPYFSIVEGELSDSGSIYGVIQNYQPDEIYHTAAMSHVGTSFEQPDFTFQVNTVGTINVLEGVRRYSPHSRVLHCSTSEMFGKCFDEQYDLFDGRTSIKYQDENTRFEPQSPYAVSKLAAHHLVRLYREAYNIFSCSSITFNHESPRRGENFVTRKITKWLSEFVHWRDLTIKWRDNRRESVLSFDEDNIVYTYGGRHASFPKLRLGNVDAYRDWGHAKDVVRAMHSMLQLKSPDDFVLATESTHSVRDFLKVAFEYIDIDNCMEYIVIDPKFFRPAEVDYLYGKASKAYDKFGWKPSVSFEELVHEMVDNDINVTKEKKKAETEVW